VGAGRATPVDAKEEAVRRSVVTTLCLMIALTMCPVVEAQDLDAEGAPDADAGLVPWPDPPETEAAVRIPALGTMLAVSWNTANAEVGTIDLDTGEWALIGSSGFPRLNSLAVSGDGVFYSVSMTDVVGDSTLITIDAATGAGTALGALTPGMDIRALAFSPGGELYAVDDTGSGSDDDLYILDTTSGAEGLVGTMTGFRGVQGLAFGPVTGILYAWDIFEGLLTVDPATAAATDVNSAIAGVSDIQTIVVLPNGVIVGGQDDLYVISPVTGEFVAVGLGDYPELRGMDFLLDPDIIFVDGFEIGSTVRW
jgi:hypothetical protein